MGDKGGRPALFESPEELQGLIDEYFQTGVKSKTYICGPPNARYDVTIEVPTITGLCRFLGFESRQSFYDYEKKDGFTYTIKRARLFIEQHYEEMLQVGNTVGAIFALKNFDWTDKQQTELTGEVKQTIVRMGKSIDLKMPMPEHSNGNGHAL